MQTKSQSPEPEHALTSQKPRKKEQEVKPDSTGRAGPAGGIMLEKTNGKAKAEEKVNVAPVSKAVSSQPSNDAPTFASSGPNRPRRRPRKLNKEPLSDKSTASMTNIPNHGETVPVPSTTELEALKSRVRGLEAKVEELYKGSADRSGRSPRRRGKGKKSSSQQVPTTSTLAETVGPEDDGGADEELVRLEDELEVARRDLESFRPRPRAKRTGSGGSDIVEEISRNEPEVDDALDTGDRQVTLTGSYRIPLPSKVSMQDVKSIQTGVTAAQNVARSFLEQRRAAAAVQAKTQTVPDAPQPSKAKPKTKGKPPPQSPSTAVTQDADKPTWSEWFGGYSMAISRAVKNIEAETAVESQQNRPPQAKRTVSGLSTNPSKSAHESLRGANRGGKRP